MPKYRAQATTGAPVGPIPDVYYGRAIVINGERVLPYHRSLPLIVAINFEARVPSQTSIPIDIVVFPALSACRPFAPYRRLSKLTNLPSNLPALAAAHLLLRNPPNIKK